MARALARDAALFIFDEPTSAMHGPEVEALCRRIDGLRARGCGVVYITHKLDEIYRLADRITVLRDGRVVGTATPAALPKAALVEWMIGRDPARAARARPPSTAAPVLTVRRLEVSHAVAGRPPVVDVSFDLRPGEIVGLAGLRGSGATEALQALFGASRSRVTGDVQVAGRPFTERTPRAAIERGVVWLTNDRKTTGLAPHQSVTHAVSLASLKRYSNAAGWMRGDEEAAAVGDLMQRFGFRAPSLDVPVGTLSGGNQQKVYLGRCLLARPRVLMLDEPTRGIDVGAKAEIHALMRAWASDGIAMLLVTTDLEELFALCDRLLVLHAGRIAAELVPAAVTRDDVLAAAMGGQTARTA